MKLSTVKAGESVIISHVEGGGAFRARLNEMGFVPGKEVKLLYRSPIGNPIVFELMGGQISLRKDEADRIFVTDANEPQVITQHYTGIHPSETIQEPVTPPTNPSGGCPGCGNSTVQSSDKTHDDEITLALIGNPNCGKTSLFNAASGGHERTGNYSGVTVSSVVGNMVFEGRHIRLVDLPGTYSIRAFSPEEAYVAHELESGKIDAVINVVDVTNLERNLLLTLQLKERNIPIVGALNMYDEFRSSHSSLDIEALSQRLGICFIPTVAKKHEGIDELLRKAIQLADAHIALHKSGVKGHTHEASCCMHNGHCACQETINHQHLNQKPDITELKNCFCQGREQDDVSRYAFITETLKGIYNKKESKGIQITKVIDEFLARRWTAYPLFILIMGFIFWMTFTVGQYPMDWIDNGVSWLTTFLESRLPEGMLRDLVCNGILGGVGSVIVFLPNILILYFLISILEDSGYLARTAMLADPLMKRMGLHGKSFIPLLMGFGCNVPAVMASRTIENNKSRFITMLVTPMMSCSARIPVYIVFTGAFFASQASAIMFILYAMGTIMALFMAWILGKIFMRDQQTHFVMELPPYRLPSASSVCRHTWEKGRQYLHKMGGIILVASVIIWALGYFPQQQEGQTAAEHQEASYMGQIGHAIEPVIAPLGYDWRMGVGIITGIGAKELMVSTLGVLYNCSEDDTTADDAESSSQTRLAQVLASHITPAAAMSYMVFALLYFPCIATIAAIKGESGRWKWALFTAGYTTVLAYVMAFIVYRLALYF